MICRDLQLGIVGMKRLFIDYDYCRNFCSSHHQNSLILEAKDNGSKI